MLIFEYTENGEPVSDFKAEGWVKWALSHVGYKHFIVSTSLPFDIIRREIVKGKIFHDQVKFRFNGEDININKYGAITDWKKGFCDKDTDVCEEILRTALELSRKEKKNVNF